MGEHEEHTHVPDVVSDPEEGVGEGKDWTDEGGATPDGPAEGR